jgi:adenylyl-sulfate kinase
MELETQPGFIIWLTGMKRTGKTTLANQVAGRLAVAGRRVEVLDEDGPAKLFLEGLGTTKDDHARVVARLGYVAKAVMKAGGVAICAVLSPYRDAREALRKDTRRFLEVFVDCAMEELQKRDATGIYKKALAGEIKDIPGVDVPYEPPAHPEVVVRTDQLSADEAARKIYQAMVDSRFIGPAEFARITGGLRPKRARPTSARGGARRNGAARAAARTTPRKKNLRGAKAAKRRR